MEWGALRLSGHLQVGGGCVARRHSAKPQPQKLKQGLGKVLQHYLNPLHGKDLHTFDPITSTVLWVAKNLVTTAAVRGQYSQRLQKQAKHLWSALRSQIEAEAGCYWIPFLTIQRANKAHPSASVFTPRDVLQCAACYRVFEARRVIGIMQPSSSARDPSRIELYKVYCPDIRARDI